MNCTEAPEIQRDILLHVIEDSEQSKSDTVGIMLLCRSFYMIVAPHVYKHVNLVDTRAVRRFAKNSAIGYCISPLAKMISLTISVDIWVPDSNHSRKSWFLDCLPNALETLTSLDSLTLCFDHENTCFFKGAIHLVACFPSSLKTLHLRAIEVRIHPEGPSTADGPRIHITVLVLRRERLDSDRHFACILESPRLACLAGCIAWRGETCRLHP